MKSILVLVGLAMASTVFANDGGTPYIIVKSVESKKVKTGQQFVIKGGEAWKLYEVLGRNFVYDVSRSVTITSGKQSVVISCSALSSKKGPNDEPIRDAANTVCTINLDAPFDPKNSEGDRSVWAPSCKQDE